MASTKNDPVCFFLIFMYVLFQRRRGNNSRIWYNVSFYMVSKASYFDIQWNRRSEVDDGRSD